MNIKKIILIIIPLLLVIFIAFFLFSQLNSIVIMTKDSNLSDRLYKAGNSIYYTKLIDSVLSVYKKTDSGEASQNIITITDVDKTNSLDINNEYIALSYQKQLNEREIDYDLPAEISVKNILKVYRDNKLIIEKKTAGINFSIIGENLLIYTPSTEIVDENNNYQIGHFSLINLKTKKETTLGEFDAWDVVIKRIDDSMAYFFVDLTDSESGESQVYLINTKSGKILKSFTIDSLLDLEPLDDGKLLITRSTKNNQYTLSIMEKDGKNEKQLKEGATNSRSDSLNNKIYTLYSKHINLEDVFTKNFKQEEKSKFNDSIDLIYPKNRTIINNIKNRACRDLKITSELSAYTICGTELIEIKGNKFNHF